MYLIFRIFIHRRQPLCVLLANSILHIPSRATEPNKKLLVTAYIVVAHRQSLIWEMCVMSRFFFLSAFGYLVCNHYPTMSVPSTSAPRLPLQNVRSIDYYFATLWAFA